MQQDHQSQRKTRGAFFTPSSLSRFMAQWSLRDPNEYVLEPSCGDAEFLSATINRFRAIGAKGRLQGQLKGVEIHADSAALATQRVAERGVDVDISVANMFDIQATPRFDVVIGNPPYIRYQSLSCGAKEKAVHAASLQGVTFNGLTNVWAPFLVHVAGFLRRGGRLALVLPAELLSVNYAAPVREFLLARFGSVSLIVFNNRVFPSVLEEVVVLLAEGEGSTDHFKLYRANDATEMNNLRRRRWVPDATDRNWMYALLPATLEKRYRASIAHTQFGTLKDWGETELGAVTGNNRYFTMSNETVSRWGIPNSELTRISPPSSKHLRGLMFGERRWEHMRVNDAAVYLFRPEDGSLSRGASEYIAHGELSGVHQAYKCRVRSPWWRVSLVRTPDLFLTYMNHVTPRLISNRARLRHLNSIHGVTLEPGLKRLGMDLLPISSLNSLTMLGAELVGRTYGGGVLKLEPRDSDALPLPSYACVLECSASLRAIRPQLAHLLCQGEMDQAVRLIDSIVLRQGLGLNQSDINTIREGKKIMFERRMARTANPR